MTVNFRKINVDAYDPELQISPEDLIPPSLVGVPPVTLAEVQAIAQQARGQLSRGDHVAALTAALDAPPYTGSDEVKAVHLATVVDILSTIKYNDMGRVVNGLTSEQRDTLVKYLYKGMAVPESHGASGVLLGWFEKVTEVAGLGAVVRFLSDKRTV
ncbi:actin-related protein 2/3 complex subunit 5 [Dipodascopsis tothii]|uniref:actin-related protein 2/3 complex subunit 5 n=1 Tax=Dipodascopsis tothii TaxID=44089 RepID=UPI0034CFC90D